MRSVPPSTSRPLQMIRSPVTLNRTASFFTCSSLMDRLPLSTSDTRPRVPNRGTRSLAFARWSLSDKRAPSVGGAGGRGRCNPLVVINDQDLRHRAPPSRKANGQLLSLENVEIKPRAALPWRYSILARRSRPSTRNATATGATNVRRPRPARTSGGPLNAFQEFRGLLRRTVPP